MTRFTEKRFLPKQSIGPDEKERLTAAIAARLSTEENIVFAYLHGSFETDKSFRDIDVAIYVTATATIDYESDMSLKLSAAIGREVEVKIINNSPVAFQMAPLQHGRLLFSRNEDARTDFLESVGRRYREYAHFRNIFMEAGQC